MTDSLQRDESPEEVIERILTKGDISGLSLADRNAYLVALAQHYGLDPAGRPFDLIPLPDGRMVPYANKNAAEQLRKLHNISVEVVERGPLRLGDNVNTDIYIVTSRASMPDGEGGRRTQDAIGAVSLKGKNADELANWIMRAATKSDRRATFAICGLGMLDESEVASIPNVRVDGPDGVKRILPGPSPFSTSLPSEMVIESPPMSTVSQPKEGTGSPIPQGVKPQIVSTKAIPKASAAPIRHPPAVPPFKVNREEK